MEEVRRRIDALKTAIIDKGLTGTKQVTTGDYKALCGESYTEDHRYLPARLMCVHGEFTVVRVEIKPPGDHTPYPIRSECTLVVAWLSNGSHRVYGCQRAYINAELRAVMVGFNARDEVLATWRKVPRKLRHK